MNKGSKYSPEVQGRAVRLLVEQRHKHSSQWAAIQSVAAQIGCTQETPRKWVKRSEGSEQAGDL